MITRKELQYVTSWASKIPMPGYEYSIDVLNQMEDCYNLFKEKYAGKEYNITFSNGEEIEFKILNGNLCHMLGIDVNNIKSDFFNDYRSRVLGTSSNDMTSYALLELILEHKEAVAIEDNNLQNRAKALNYYKSSVKSQIFKKFINFEQFNFGAINLIGERDDIDYTKQKMLYIQSGEQLVPYFMMGLKQQSSDDYYIVATLLSPENAKDKFENQEVIIPTQIIISDDNDLSKIVASPEDKMRLITIYQSIINQYNIPNNLNIYGDYLSTLNDMSRVRK